MKTYVPIALSQHICLNLYSSYSLEQGVAKDVTAVYTMYEYKLTQHQAAAVVYDARRTEQL